MQKERDVGYFSGFSEEEGGEGHIFLIPGMMIPVFFYVMFVGGDVSILR